MKKCILCLLLAATSVHWAGSTALAYPPDNAAVLYYQAFALMEYPDDQALREAIWDYRNGKIELTDPLRIYLDKHEYVFKLIRDAGALPHCDWGLDYAQGIDVMFPMLAKARQACFAVLAQARRDFLTGDQDAAFDMCFAVHRLGHHVEGDCIIPYLVGIALHATANGLIRDLLGLASLEEDALIRLKKRTLNVFASRRTLKAATQKEIIKCTHSICPEGRAALIKNLECDQNNARVIAKIKGADSVFWERSLQYYLNFMARALEALDLPFTEAHAKLTELEKKPSVDAKTNDYALVTAALAPALWKCLWLDIRVQTEFNALTTGIEILSTNTRTGKLPPALPAHMPKEHFSGLDFVYEKTSTGFVLSCQALDPNKKNKKKNLKFEFVLP